MNSKKTLLPVLLLIAPFLFTSCGQSYVGRYTGTAELGLPVSMELRNNGTVTFDAMGLSQTGTYQINGSKLTIKISGNGNTLVGTISGDTIEFQGAKLYKSGK